MKLIKAETNKGIVFNDGTTIIDHHDQDCCEHVYADFDQLADTNIFDNDFNEIEIEGVKEAGFRLNGYFVPCYDQQNGYYSNDLALIIKKPDGFKRKVDVSDFVKHEID